jgi:hypothetical protein
MSDVEEPARNAEVRCGYDDVCIHTVLRFRFWQSLACPHTGWCSCLPGDRFIKAAGAPNAERCLRQHAKRSHDCSADSKCPACQWMRDGYPGDTWKALLALGEPQAPVPRALICSLAFSCGVDRSDSARSRTPAATSSCDGSKLTRFAGKCVRSSTTGRRQGARRNQGSRSSGSGSGSVSNVCALPSDELPALSSCAVGLRALGSGAQGADAGLARADSGHRR